ncbi:hypothetical protein L1887_10739 [Cichorium endivia]|nr:hypothetical protein L1887_10739 [Cichorium endivia]
MTVRRRSSRRGENAESRFSNTPDNPVTVDGEADDLDDFVDPLKGIPSTTVIDKGDNIKQPVNMIDVSSSKPKKKKSRKHKPEVISITNSKMLTWVTIPDLVYAEYPTVPPPLYQPIIVAAAHRRHQLRSSLPAPLPLPKPTGVTNFASAT